MTASVHPLNRRPERASGCEHLAAHAKLNAAANAAAAVTLADPGDFAQNVIGGVYWSYSGAPTGGKLTISAAGTTLLEVHITAAGPGQLDLEGFSPGRSLALTATLAAGGGGVYGTVGFLNPIIEVTG